MENKVNISKKTVLKLIMVSLGAAFVFAIFFSAAKFFKNYEMQTKERIIIQLRQEIKEIVKEEIKPYLENYAALPQKAARSSDTASAPQTLKVQVKDLVRHELSSFDELDAYVGGESNKETTIAGGLKKEINTTNSQNNPDIPPDAKEEDIKPVDQTKVLASKSKAIESTLIDKGDILLPKGKLQIEPSFTTAHFSSNRINIEGFSILPVLVIGIISTESVKRDIFIESLSFKYGILRNLQGELKIPYRYEFDRITSNIGTESTKNVGGLGDIEFGLSRQIASEHAWIPDLVLGVSAKSDSGLSPYNRSIGLGTGHWAVRGMLLASKSSDPVAVFGGLNYTWSIPRNITNYGRVDPGDVIGYNLGAAIALSYQTAINFQLEQSLTSKMKIDDYYVSGSFLNSANFKTGFTWTVNDRFSVNIGGAVGLTTDSPDYVIDIRCPYTF